MQKELSSAAANHVKHDLNPHQKCHASLVSLYLNELPRIEALHLTASAAVGPYVSTPQDLITC
jgi:hypothetical protein